MTHGQITIIDSDGEKIFVYAWHDGHTDVAVEMLIRLPWIVFNAAKNAWYQAYKNKDYQATSGFDWYDMLLREGSQKTAEYARKNTYATWRALIPTHTCAIGIANWIAWQSFNHWQVVREEDCIYDLGGLEVHVNEDHIASYTIKMSNDLVGIGDTDFIQEVLKELRDTLPKSPAESLPSILEGDKEFPVQIIVPVDRIFCELHIVDINKILYGTYKDCPQLRVIAKGQLDRMRETR